MTTLNRDQLVSYIRTLESKVKRYAAALKKRDQEIIQLRKKLNTLIYKIREQSKQRAATLESDYKFEQNSQKKVKTLEEKRNNFIKQDKINNDQHANDNSKNSIQNNSKDGDSSSDAMQEHHYDHVEQDPNASVTTPDSTDNLQENKPSAPIAYAPTLNFAPGEFLNAVLEGEEEKDEAKSLLEQLHNCEPDQKRHLLLSLTSLHWRMIASMGKRLMTESLSWEKRLFMRYGMLDETLMADRMDVWEQLYLDKSKPGDTGIYFIDEWIEEIARGNIKFSTIDELALDGKKPNPNAYGEEALRYELINIPQMQRMCVGPRANSISILVQEYCTPNRDNPVINRRWLQDAMTYCRKCDTKIFQRRYKGEEIIVQPYFIITPGYGQKAGCWEPWSPGHKGNSGPRICICAFPPRNSMKALIYGLADYRWEYAKADAMHYWLTEGLTGRWLALFSKKEQRKDLKQFFIHNYFLWVTKEANRIPKLEKRFREFFWHNIPFSDEIKQGLKGGGMFGRLIELEEAKKKREEEERQELERLKAQREARRAARKAKLEGHG